MTKGLTKMPILKTIQNKFELVVHGEILIRGSSDGHLRTQNHNLKVFDCNYQNVFLQGRFLEACFDEDCASS